MHLLFLTSQMPYPPHAGGALRAYGLISGLGAAGYTIDLITFVAAGGGESDPTPLSDLCEKIVTVPLPPRSGRDRLRDALFTNHADMVQRFASPEFARALTALVTARAYDLAMIEGLEMSPYLPILKQHVKKVVYDALNAEYDLQRLIYQVDRRNLTRLHAALYSLIQWRRLERVERSVCQMADAVVAVSDLDASLLQKLAPTTRLAVVPNGIYTAEYLPAPTKQLALGNAPLLFTGTMDYRPNVDAMVWFTESVLSEIRSAVPDARLFIVGNRPHPRLAGIRGRGDVEITGFVQDVAPFLHSAAVYVAPLRMGSGTRLKLLQAMAAGCAIVSTRIGAMGLDVTSGREMILADDAGGFASAVTMLLRDPERRRAMGVAAQKLVCERYDWSALVPQMVAFYQQMGVAATGGESSP